MPAIEDIAAFVTRNWSGIAALLALFVAGYSLWLQRLSVRREHIAHEIRFGPLPEELVLGPVGDARAPVQAINDTGRPQVVRDLWLRIVDYPSELTEEQIGSLMQTVSTFTDAMKEFLGRPDIQQQMIERGANSDAARGWFPRFVAFSLNVIDKFRTGRVEIQGPRRFYAFLFNRMNHVLADMADVFHGPQAEAAMQFLLPRIDLFKGIAPEGELPVTKSVNVAIPPREVREIEADFTPFRGACANALQFVGGKFRFTCVLEARVAGTEKRSESDLFEVIVDVPPFDWGPIATEFREELRKMRLPP